MFRACLRRLLPQLFLVSDSPLINDSRGRTPLPIHDYSHVFRDFRLHFPADRHYTSDRLRMQCSSPVFGAMRLQPVASANLNCRSAVRSRIPSKTGSHHGMIDRSWVRAGRERTTAQRRCCGYQFPVGPGEGVVAAPSVGSTQYCVRRRQIVQSPNHSIPS